MKGFSKNPVGYLVGLMIAMVVGVSVLNVFLAWVAAHMLVVIILAGLVVGLAVLPKVVKALGDSGKFNP